MDNQQEILPEELAYLGGLIDGEGSVGIYTTTHRSKTPGGKDAMRVKPSISFANTEKALVDEYCRILDRLNVPYHVSHRASQGRNAESWQVSTTGMKRTIKLLPYLAECCRGKKRLQALDLIEYCNLRMADWHAAPFTTRQIELIEQIYARNYGRRIPRDYTRSGRSSKYPT